MLRVLVRKVGNQGKFAGEAVQASRVHSDRPERPVYSRLSPYSHHSQPIPSFHWNILGISRAMPRIDFSGSLYHDWKEVEKDRLVYLLLAEFELMPVDR